MHSKVHTGNDKNKPRALILTNHMANIAGSEIVALEVAELLQKKGYQVSLHCNYLADPMAGMLAQSNIAASDRDVFPNVFDYDFVWSQHQVIASALAQNPLPEQWPTRFVSAHLSPYALIETTGIVSALYLGSQIVVNSHETASRLSELGVDQAKIIVSYNACPEIFRMDDAARKNSLQRILLVSNHPPAEVMEALNILKTWGIEVQHIGIDGEYRRVFPEDIAVADAVITIGKTVQYAVMGGTPVYCYDHLGGPGWLVEENFDTAEKFNFSGRGCGEKKTPHQIAGEIREGHLAAAGFVHAKRELRRELYSLDRLMQRLTQADSRDSFESAAQRKIFQERLATDAVSNALIRQSYRSERNYIALLDDSKNQLKTYASQVTRLRQEVKDCESQVAFLQQEIREKDAMLATITSSRSWRITRPLRFLGRLVRYGLNKGDGK